ncbi:MULTISPECIES: hypothetical protein [unclassified Streptomyces]|uniref:hypothetical protein n=1 Tax=unclassified Streptomyces TaxID=2593676 RepID=UPI001F38FA61|nr:MULTISPECIES: hypothetical protein [unclassified Streptomyces]
MMTRTIPARAGSTCPICEGNFETCRCTGATPLGSPRAGVADDIRREDDRSGHDGRGYERDETDRCFQQLVEQLVADGDTRAAVAGRRARRTLQEMAPGYVRQPVLNLLHRPVMGQCPLCERWNCPGHDCPPGVTALDEQGHKDLSDKVGKKNERSENPYPK